MVWEILCTTIFGNEKKGEVFISLFSMSITKYWALRPKTSDRRWIKIPGGNLSTFGGERLHSSFSLAWRTLWPSTGDFYFLLLFRKSDQGPFYVKENLIQDGSTPPVLNRRQILHQYWARWGCWFKYLPFNLNLNYLEYLKVPAVGPHPRILWWEDRDLLCVAWILHWVVVTCSPRWLGRLSLRFHLCYKNQQTFLSTRCKLFRAVYASALLSRNGHFGRERNSTGGLPGAGEEVRKTVNPYPLLLGSMYFWSWLIQLNRS